MAGRLAGKAALITGGTSGIGEATVELFLAEGCQVMIAGRNAEKGQAMVAALGPNARFIAADITQEAEIKAAIDATAHAFGRLDCLFSNAGGPTRGGADSFTAEDYRYAMDLLLGSVLFGIKYAAPIMKAQGRGAIINNSSVAALRGHMGGYLYSIAKAGVKRATEMAGMELGPFGVTVNCISPGAIATPIFFGGSKAASGLDPAHADAKLQKLTRNLANATPLHRSGLPHDIATAALFLASDEGAYINCHDLVVDGGMIAGGRTSFETQAAGAPV
ncbi:MAG: SDR family oxidoreductase [Alphaproteobacteria bacterium]|nr:SDR family oxidoreductase [Alphaproteobacteria bacterium]MBU1516409.1 SDR family oxidoreductase [Alphaproteobacteria bacterium]MBU2093354.1 SDR family oxidoreductase [Alphaproteobacteria bacterium]MBU2153841.1 SDR family oxidoreductase [Alphaproteobacteria bacterium]MBU2307713.1 SDR family oxidoreductase [Alphaproteobacteria bacterium]